MAAQIEVEAVGSAVGDGSYDVTWTAQNEVDMPSEIFLVDRATQKFQRVIVPADLVYPTSSSPTEPYYRQSSVTANYPDITTAESAKTTVDGEVQSLVDEYNAGLTDLLTTETTTYT